MAEIISLYDHPDFDYPYGACTECDGSDFKMILSPAGEDISIIGFQCSNIDCGVVGMFPEESEVIVFELDKDV